tara:strand:- start:665 stop:799 length:135 start_codon:yes stop_codon:yes gene_type:complete
MINHPKETDEQRRDRALKRMLNTPPTPHKSKDEREGGKKEKPGD